jgi:hypothetical protein
MAGPEQNGITFSIQECDLDSLRNLTRTAAHEYTHKIQQKLSNTMSLSLISHTWLIEGIAEYFGRTISEAGFYSEIHNIYLLEDMENFDGFSSINEGYLISSFAILLLVETYSEPISLLKFYEEVGNGIALETAFENSFGIEIDEFYQVANTLDIPSEVIIFDGTTTSVEVTDFNVETRIGEQPFVSNGIIPEGTALLYESPETSSLSITCAVSPSTMLSTTQRYDDWYLINCPNGSFQGWILAADFAILESVNDADTEIDLTIEPFVAEAQILRPFISLSTFPNSQSSVTACSGNVIISGRYGEWYQVTCTTGEMGWLPADSLEITTSE